MKEKGNERGSIKKEGRERVSTERGGGMKGRGR